VTTDKRSQATEKAYKFFNDAIADPAQRRALANDPDGTLKAAGINIRDLPTQIRRLLEDLSYEELRVLARYNAALEKSGLVKETQSAKGYSTIAKF
jgi:hypothetical protein